MARRRFGGSPKRFGIPLLRKERLRHIGAARQLVLLCACILALVAPAGGSACAQTAASPPAPAATLPAAAPTAGSQAVCLGCHGPYEKIIAATANYYMPSGETMSPHRYVPHKSTNIPDCKNCHQAHPIPPASKASVPTPSTDWCYKCHHANVLECGTCH